MRIIIFLICLFWTVNAFALKLTQQQFDNLDIIHKALKAKDTNFVGLNGSKDDMKVIGMSEEDAQKEINKINFNTIISEKEAKEKDNKKTDLLAILEITQTELNKLKNLP